MTLFESGLLENRDVDQKNNLKCFDIDFKAKKKFSARQKPNSLGSAGDFSSSTEIELCKPLLSVVT